MVNYSAAWITPVEAAELLVCSRRHIQNLVKDGKIKGVKEDGKYYIDKEAFFQDYPEAEKMDLALKPKQNEIIVAKIKMENSFLKEMMSHKDKEIEFLRKQLATKIEAASNKKRWWEIFVRKDV